MIIYFNALENNLTTSLQRGEWNEVHILQYCTVLFEYLYFDFDFATFQRQTLHFWLRCCFRYVCSDLYVWSLCWAALNDDSSRWKQWCYCVSTSLWPDQTASHVSDGWTDTATGPRRIQRSWHEIRLEIIWDDSKVMSVSKGVLLLLLLLSLLFSCSHVFLYVHAFRKYRTNI